MSKIWIKRNANNFLYGIIKEKGCDKMKEEDIIDIDEEICNKVIVVDTEAETDDYERKKFFEELNIALAKSEDDIKNGRVRDAKIVFK